MKSKTFVSHIHHISAIVALLFAVFFFFSPGRYLQAAMLPFGGKVVEVTPTPCGGLVHVTVLTMKGTISLMLDGATKVHLFGPPSHSGQNVLGWYNPTQITCSPFRAASISGGRIMVVGSSL